MGFPDLSVTTPYQFPGPPALPRMSSVGPWVRRGRIAGRPAELATCAIAVERGARGESHASVILLHDVKILTSILISDCADFFMMFDWGLGFVVAMMRTTRPTRELCTALGLKRR